MVRSMCFLVSLVVLVNYVCSWDVAITTGDQIEFYSKDTKISTVEGPFTDLAGLTYDTVHDKVFFVDNYHDTASVYSYQIGTENSEIIIKNAPAYIHNLAFDPMTQRLFWTDYRTHGIYWKSIADADNDFNGNVLFDEFKNDVFPLAIAVDTCRGYVYWSNWAINSPATIQKIRVDGSDRKLLVTDLEFPNALVIDQQTKSLFFLDTTADEHYYIYSSDLEGKNRKTLLAGYKNVPIALTVSKNSLYWVDDWSKHIWKLVKTAKGVNQGQFASVYKHVEKGSAVAANYDVFDQTDGVMECEVLRNLAEEKFCLHGTKLLGKMACKCFMGYIGERCEVSLCRNFCGNGPCRLSSDAVPQCICESNSMGERSNVNFSNDTSRIRSLQFLYILIISGILQTFTKISL